MQRTASMSERTPTSARIDGNTFNQASSVPHQRTLSNIDAASGALAGFTSSIFVAPLDLIKTRLQAQKHAKSQYMQYLETSEKQLYKGIKDEISTVWLEEGIRGFYRGLGPLMIGYVPSWGIYFTTYDYCKRKTIPHSSSDIVGYLASAVIAATCSTVLTNPIWVIKTRLMTQRVTPGAETRYRGTFHCMRRIWAEEGVRTFYRGLAPSLLGIFHVAVQFPLYEKLKAALASDEDPQQRLWLRVLLASTISKMVASTVTYPHEILRTRMQTLRVRHESRSRLLPLARDIFAQEGIAAFYHGLAISLFRTIPATAVTFVTYESFKAFFSERFGITTSS